MGAFSYLYASFDFCIGYIFIIVFLCAYILRYRNISVNPTFLALLLILAVSSFVNVCFGNDTFFYMSKQIIGISVTGIAYYLLFKINNFEFDKLFKIYLRVALVVAVIGIFQEFNWLIGFERGYDYSSLIPKWTFARTASGVLRVNSIFMEPSHFAITMSPAFFVALSNIFKSNSLRLKSKLSSAIIMISYVLTFSAIACVGIFISLWLILFTFKKFKHMLLVLGLMMVFIYASYWYVPGIQKRADSVVQLIDGSKKATDVHLSVHTVVSHAFVACKTFAMSPMFGHGLGSHPISYDRFIRSGISCGLWKEGITETNKADASSLLVRLVSETGLVGVIAVLFFIWKFRVKKSGNRELYIVNNAVFVLFILQLLKQGHYFYNGLFFFVWLYYVSGKVYREGELKDC